MAVEAVQSWMECSLMVVVVQNSWEVQLDMVAHLLPLHATVAGEMVGIALDLDSLVAAKLVSAVVDSVQSSAALVHGLCFRMVWHDQAGHTSSILEKHWPCTEIDLRYQLLHYVSDMYLAVVVLDSRCRLHEFPVDFGVPNTPSICT